MLKNLLLPPLPVLFLSSFLIFCITVFLKSTYEENASLWQPGEAMKSYTPWLTLGQIVISIGFVTLFTKAYKRGGLVEGQYLDY